MYKCTYLEPFPLSFSLTDRYHLTAFRRDRIERKRMNDKLNAALNSSVDSESDSDLQQLQPAKYLKRRNSLTVQKDVLDHAQVDVSLVDGTSDTEGSFKILFQMQLKPSVLKLTGEKSSFSEWKHLCDGPHSRIYKSNLIPSASRPVVVKILKEKSVQNEIALREFNREKETLARISHENIVDLYAYGIQEESSLPFLALERLDGSTLSSILREPRYL